MNFKKLLSLSMIIIFLYTSIILSQSNQKDLLKNSLEHPNNNEQTNKHQLDNKVNERPGGPFNSITNSQIDSVVLNTDDGETVKYSYQFNSSGNVTTTLKAGGSKNNIVNYWKEAYSYDSTGNVVTDIFRTWVGGKYKWLNVSHQTNFYDSSGKRILHLQKYWDDTVWVYERRVTSFYNSNGNDTLQLDEEWDGSKWQNSFREIKSYDANNNELSSILNQNWQNGAWDTSTWKDSYTYDSLGRLHSVLTETLNGNQWENSVKFKYNYDENGNRILLLYEVWNGNDWNNYFRNNYTYDLDKNITLRFVENWQSGEWINYSNVNYIYDLNGDIKKAESEQWDINNWIPSNGSIFIYDSYGNRRGYYGTEMQVFYAELTSYQDDELNPAVYSLSQNYPNPFNPSTCIKYSIPVAGHVKLVIYDILGKELQILVNQENAKGDYKVNFNAPSYSSGVYFYRLQSGSFSETKKLILLR